MPSAPRKPQPPPYLILPALLLAAGACLCLGGCVEDKPRDPLRVEFREGQRFVVELESLAEVRQNLLGVERIASFASRETLAFDVASADVSGSAWVRVTFEAIAFESKGAGAGASYDSAKALPALTPEAKALAALKGRSFWAWMSPAGRVIETSGLDKLLDDAWLAASPPENAPGDGEKALPLANRSVLSESRFKRDLEQHLGFYPLKPAGLQDAWNQRFAVEGPVPLAVERTCELVSREGGEARVDFTLSMAPDNSAAASRAGGLGLVIDLSGAGKGSARIDEKTGWLVAAKHGAQAKGEASIPGAGGSAGLSWPISVSLRSEARTLEHAILSETGLAALKAERAAEIARVAEAEALAREGVGGQARPALSEIDGAFARYARALRPELDAIAQRADAVVDSAVNLGNKELANLDSAEALNRRIAQTREASAACAQAIEALEALPFEFAKRLRQEGAPREWRKPFLAKLSREFQIRQRVRLRLLERDACDSIIRALEILKIPNMSREKFDEFVRLAWDVSEKMRQRRDLREAIDAAAGAGP